MDITIPKSPPGGHAGVRLTAIAAFVEAESWQLDEVQIGSQELDEGGRVPHKDVANWLRSWGRKRERTTPRA